MLDSDDQFEEVDCDYLKKLIIIGDSTVGKTCILLRFMKRGFNKEHLTTIGINN